MLTRRAFFAGGRAALSFAGVAWVWRMAGLASPPALARAVETAPPERPLEALPGKKPLYKLTSRPPNYETPIEYFRRPITPNEAFYVRYHVAEAPDVDANNWRLKIGGEGAAKALEFSLDDLKSMPATEVVAVNQCSGNRRGLVEPHVPGVQWRRGAMGCARWRGVRLRDLLEKIELKKETLEIAFQGADHPVLDKTPSFIKSLPIEKALEETTIIAYEMNGAPLPKYNGFPARLVAPGWTATYWMKHLTSINALLRPESSFWMKTAYRVPLGKFPTTARFSSQEAGNATPITEIMVNSVIASHDDGETINAGRSTSIAGVAWDGGHGVTSVEISLDGGLSWEQAKLGEDLGPFAFRTFDFSLPRPPRGRLAVMARATNRIGQTQPASFIPNPAGYHHNVIQTITLNVA